MKKIILFLYASALSGLLFLFIVTLLQFVIANYISDKPAWPDEKSLSWRLSSNIFGSIVYVVPFAFGALLSWSSLQAATPSLITWWSTVTATICALIFAIGGRTELSADPTISIGILLAWPVFILVVSALGIRYVA